jgi:hypothetical protein
MADPTGDPARLRRLEVRPAEDRGELVADLSHVLARCQVQAVCRSAQDAFRGHLATVLLGSLCTSPQLATTGIGF